MSAPTRAQSILILLPPMAAGLLLCLAMACLAAPAVSPSEPDRAVPPRSANEADALWRRARGLDSSPFATLERIAGGLAPDPMDEHWLADYGLPVPDGPITSLLPYQGLLLAGGSFQRIGDLESPGVATWDGARWSRLGDFPGGRVQQLASHAGGVLALDETPRLWRWDGSTWTPLAPFPSFAASAFDMTVREDQIAVSVRTSGDHPRNSRVLVYSAGDWVPLGEDFDDAVYGLEWYQDELYAAGWFRHVGTAERPMVARWDGVDWQEAHVGLPVTTGAYLRDLAVLDGELVTCGLFFDTTSTGPRFVAHWDGAAWRAMGRGVPGYLLMSRLKVEGSSLYVIGAFYDGRTSGVAHWDGTQWFEAEDSLSRTVYDVALYQGDLYAAGALSNDGSFPASSLVRRRAGRWESPLKPTSGMQGLAGAFGPDVRTIVSLDTAIVAAGRFEFAGVPGGWLRSSSAVRRDSTAWSALSMPWLDATPYRLAVQDTNLYAVGSFGLISFEYHGVAQYHRGRWTLVSEPFPNPFTICFAFGTMVVGGLADSTFQGIAAFNGVAWQRIPGGGITRGTWISSITTHAGEMIAAGIFDQIGTVRCRNIARWSEFLGWRPMTDGLPYPVTDLLSQNGVLYAAMDAGEGTPGVARWTDDHWDLLAPGGMPSSSVSSLGWYHGRLI